MDLKEEIEKLKAKKLELLTRANLSNDEAEKEEIKEEIKRIEKQIETLEKYYN